MGVGEMGQIIGETGVGETGVGEMGVNQRHQAFFARVNKRHNTFLPPWTEDTRQFCHRGQKTPDYFATLDRRHHFSKVFKVSQKTPYCLTSLKKGLIILKFLNCLGTQTINLDLLD